MVEFPEYFNWIQVSPDTFMTAVAVAVPLRGLDQSPAAGAARTPLGGLEGWGRGAVCQRRAKV